MKGNLFMSACNHDIIDKTEVQWRANTQKNVSHSPDQHTALYIELEICQVIPLNYKVRSGNIKIFYLNLHINITLLILITTLILNINIKILPQSSSELQGFHIN